MKMLERDFFIYKLNTKLRWHLVCVAFLLKPVPICIGGQCTTELLLTGICQNCFEY